MKLVLLIAASIATGAALGVALARKDVGPIESRLYPRASVDGDWSPEDSAGPAIVEGSGPVAAVDSPSHDFGTMQRGTTESHEFVVTNKGKRPLTLQVGSTTCKCTLGEVSSRPLEPGESTPVRLEWVAKSQPGDFRQVATVLTNDPLRTRLELTVNGQIVEPAGLQPSELLFGRMSADEQRTASVFLASFDTDPEAEPLTATVRLVEGSSLEGKIEVRAEPVAAEDLPQADATSGVKITATAGPGLPLGHVTEWVKVKTNLPRPKMLAPSAAGKSTNLESSDRDELELQIPLYAYIEGDISLRGFRWSKQLGLLNLGKIRRADGASEKVLISFKGDHAKGAQAEVLAVDPQWLQVDLGEPREVRPGVTHQLLTLTIPPGQKPVVRSGAGEDEGGIGPGDAHVLLSTNHPVTNELDVPVRFVIAE